MGWFCVLFICLLCKMFVYLSSFVFFLLCIYFVDITHLTSKKAGFYMMDEHEQNLFRIRWQLSYEECAMRDNSDIFVTIVFLKYVVCFYKRNEEVTFSIFCVKKKWYINSIILLDRIQNKYLIHFSFSLKKEDNRWFILI